VEPLKHYFSDKGELKFDELDEYDDGLMYVGTKYCFNHENPRCKGCPLKGLCKGSNEDRTLIEGSRHNFYFFFIL